MSTYGIPAGPAFCAGHVSFCIPQVMLASSLQHERYEALAYACRWMLRCCLAKSAVPASIHLSGLQHRLHPHLPPIRCGCCAAGCAWPCRQGVSGAVAAEEQRRAAPTRSAAAVRCVGVNSLLCGWCTCGCCAMPAGGPGGASLSMWQAYKLWITSSAVVSEQLGCFNILARCT